MILKGESWEKADCEAGTPGWSEKPKICKTLIHISTLEAFGSRIWLGGDEEGIFCQNV